MKHISLFEEWNGTIKVDQNEIDRLWKHAAKMPERFFNYIQKEISPVECRLAGNTTIIIGDLSKKFSVEMSAGFNMVRTIDISVITIWLGFGSTGNYQSEDGYFNTTIYTYTGSPHMYGKDYNFTSDTIEDLCEFLNKIFKEKVIEFNEPD